MDLRFAATKTTAATTTTIRMLTIVTFHDKTSNNFSSLNLGHRLASKSTNSDKKSISSSGVGQMHLNEMDLTKKNLSMNVI